MWKEKLRQHSATLAVSAAAAAAAGATLWVTRGAAVFPPDALEYAGAARSLVQGHGYTIDLVEIHPELAPTIRHLHELHGLLEPLLIAPIFAAFGPVLSLSRLPGVFATAGLAGASYVLGRAQFGTVAGLVAAVFVLTRIDLALSGAFGSDDVVWALCSTLAVHAFLEATRSPGERKWPLFAGLAAALATLSKFTGAILPAVFVVTALLTPAVRRVRGSRAWALLVVPSLCAALAYALRNYLLHGHLGFRYSALDWLSKVRSGAYFSLYDSPPKLGEVWRLIGASNMLSLTGHQLKLLGLASLADPVVLLGGPFAILASFRKARPFATLSVLYLAAVVFTACFVYHVELRYFFALHPLFYAAIGGLVGDGTELVARRLDDQRRRLALGAGAVALAGILVVKGVGVLELVATTGAAARAPMACDDALAYLRTNAGPREPITTSSPWLVAWKTERPAVIAPTNGLAAFVRVVRHYRVRWAITGFPSFATAEVYPLLMELNRSRDGIRVLRAFDGVDCDVYALVDTTPQAGANP